MFHIIIKTHDFFRLKAQYQSLKNSHFGDISLYRNHNNDQNYFDISFRVVLALSEQT